MQSIKEAAAAFLATKRVAVTGVSRTPKTHGSNNVYRRLRERGYQVFAVNPNTGQVEGDRCYPDLASTPAGVQAVDRDPAGDRRGHHARVRRAGHQTGVDAPGPGAGSVSAAATGYGRTQGITVIDGGCPLMFGPTADFGHKIMRVVLSGHVPKQACPSVRDALSAYRG